MKTFMDKKIEKILDVVFIQTESVHWFYGTALNQRDQLKRTAKVNEYQQINGIFN